MKDRIRTIAEQLDGHRKARQSLSPKLTITGMYNVLQKLQAGDTLSVKEKAIHEDGLVSVLRQFHDELDAAVFDAYGWPPGLADDEVLDRLVMLNRSRLEEERGGLIRWLRADLQSRDSTGVQGASSGATRHPTRETAAPKSSAKPWPKKLSWQIQAIRTVVTTSQNEWSVEQVAGRFKNAKRTVVEDVLDSLSALGLLIAYQTEKGRRWRSSQVVSSA